MEALLVASAIALVGWSYARRLLPPWAVRLAVQIAGAAVAVVATAGALLVLPDPWRYALGVFLLLVGLVVFILERRRQTAALRAARSGPAASGRAHPRRRLPPPPPGAPGP